MKKSEIKILSVLIIMFFFLFFETFFHYLNIYYLLFWLISTLLLIKLVGYKKDTYAYKIDLIQIILIYSFTYLILIYLSGLYFGYTKVPYSLAILKVLKNIIPIIILIFFQEIFRYIITKKTKNKFIISLLIILFIAFEIKINIPFYSTTTPLEIFELIGVLIIPTIIKNFLFSYIAYKGTITVNIIYRIIFETYIYLVPIIPDLGIYFEAIFNIMLPTIIFLRINTFFAKNKPIHNKKNKLITFFITAPVFLILIIIVVLSSNMFKHSIIAIASNSMYPEIKRGDAVIIEKTNDFENLIIGDILAFKTDNKIIVHRIVEIEKNYKKYIFTTKGDNNKNKDNYVIKETDIIGEVNIKIPYIGYPSIWLSEQIGKR